RSPRRYQAVFAIRTSLRTGMSALLSKRKALLLFAAIAVVSCSTEALAAEKTANSALSTNLPAGKPEIFSLEPRGVQRGGTNRIKLIGTNLLGLTELKLHSPKLYGELLAEPEAATNTAWIELRVPPDLPRGPYELSVKNTNAESGKI